MRGRDLIRPRRFCILSVAAIISSLLAVFFVAELFHLKAVSAENGSKTTVFYKENSTNFARKLLQLPDAGNRNRIGTACSKDDIDIVQGSTAPLPNGIPSYTVQILNVCVSGCSISNIHVSCGWFSSARLISPSVFQRIYYDDCLVNDGEPLGPGEPSPSSMPTVFCTHCPSLLLTVVKSMRGVWCVLRNVVLLCGISLLFIIIIMSDRADNDKSGPCYNL